MPLEISKLKTTEPGMAHGRKYVSLYFSVAELGPWEIARKVVKRTLGNGLAG